MGKKTSILIAEDEAMIAMLMELKLKRLGYEVFKPVATGEKAIEVARQENPDVILMDILLVGDMDGIEAACEIRSHSEVPIIFVTSYSDEETRERAKQINPLDYVMKPINFDELKSIIDSHFYKKGN